MPVCPGGTGSASPTSGRPRTTPPSRLRAISVTAGCAGSSCSDCVRSVPVRATPGSCASACTKAGAKVAVSVLLVPPLLPLPRPPEVARTYRSAGSTTSSQCVTDSRKLATITVSATARLRLATTPLTATAAVPRMRRARSTASIGSTRRANAGATRSYSSAMSQGRAVMPPTSRQATDRYAATGMPPMAGRLASAAPAPMSPSASQW
ncbi:hypothetical protein D9M72_293860 [compost metagenome]